MPKPGELVFAHLGGELYKHDLGKSGFTVSHRPMRKYEPILYMGDRKVLVQDGIFFVLEGRFWWQT